VSANDLKLVETWEDIAERARHEQDPQKLTQLAQKLFGALTSKPRVPRETEANQKWNAAT
jgi:hypothetical protein